MTVACCQWVKGDRWCATPRHGPGEGLRAEDNGLFAFFAVRKVRSFVIRQVLDQMFKVRLFLVPGHNNYLFLKALH
jgi:hypothetical protein